MLSSSIETNKLSSQISPLAVALGNQCQLDDFVLDHKNKPDEKVWPYYLMG